MNQSGFAATMDLLVAGICGRTGATYAQCWPDLPPCSIHRRIVSFWVSLRPIPDDGRGHSLGWIRGADSLIETAGGRVARQNQLALASSALKIRGVEPQFRHSMGFIRPVTRKTVIGKNRTNVSIIVQRPVGGHSAY